MLEYLVGYHGANMTHQNHQTNGASLEDCHTNFFALVSGFPATRYRTMKKMRSYLFLLYSFSVYPHGFKHRTVLSIFDHGSSNEQF